MKKKNTPFIGKLVKKVIKVSDIDFAYRPIRHQKLPPDLEERIRKFEPVFEEVYPKSHEEWLEGFKCDINPQSEVRLWEAMAYAYQTFLRNRSFSRPARKEIFGLLVTAGGTIEETLSLAKLDYLTRSEATEVLQLYAEALSKSHKPFSPN
jgi:hypothetical protein